MKIIICDDDRRIHKEYSKKIQSLAKKHRLHVSLRNFMNGEALLNDFEKSDFKADLIFLDIKMPVMEGDTVAQELRKRKYENDIVFLTVSKQLKHFKKAMKYKAMEYLVKDQTDDEEFEHIFLDAVKSHNERECEYVSLSFAGETKNIAINDIHYFEFFNRKIIVYYEDNKTFEFWDSLSRFEKQLEFYGFLRAHNAYLVKISFISEVKRKELILKNGINIPINKDNATRFKKVLDNYIRLSND